MYDHSQRRTERRMGSFAARLSKALAEESSIDSESSDRPEDDEPHDEAHDPVKKRQAASEKDSLKRCPQAHANAANQ
ncbi:hypothetical protein N7499_003718 [Penicillium canescens]|uniref:Uncharacterized protein n=2 Tax=Penicillium canescens TaxID=5083 RepID=A0AAD6IAF6_PENCN|nr:hypothetical protein N7522_001866 [Penicillium canescens]KAJ6038843.1 hypothetical protein N7460_007560 [Penicillium canescens]KAJ6066374.1 hypothetical protein N7444_000127 [Penicillium canescens]KAJ6091004.1 hypothetical protein N7499_003718 [Penicillium canescens]KAJ6175227.1 hypothetical protein N7485_005032 [Penicillium canescens]